MERKFYPENFEKFLKGHADQFKMTPSKKTWHGIYNDLHPGRRWPSITMSLVFIFALVIIGHLNSNNNYRNSSALNILSASNSPGLASEAALKTKNHLEAATVTSKQTKPLAADINKNEFASDQQALNNSSADNSSSLNNNYKRSIIDSRSVAKSHLTIIKNENLANKNNLKDIQSNTSTNQQINSAEDVTPLTSEQDENNRSILSESNIKIDAPVKQSSASIIAAKQVASNPEVSKLKVVKVRKNPVVWNYYITPSLSYRHFSDKKIDNAVNQKFMIGYEAGSAFNVRLKKDLRFTTGLQLNYSGYNIKASTVHPILATLLLNSETIQGQYIYYSSVSHYGNGTGNEETKLKNYSLQVSLPIGLQYSFGGNNDVKFNAEATFQPSYIIKSNAYLLSTDSKNYMTDADISRKWNMSTNFSTYVSVNSNSYNWQIGPQIRYQLLSSYLSAYPVKEHLINYGVRIGISKISK